MARYNWTFTGVGIHGTKDGKKLQWGGGSYRLALANYSTWCWMHCLSLVGCLVILCGFLHLQCGQMSQNEWGDIPGQSPSAFLFWNWLWPTLTMDISWVIWTHLVTFPVPKAMHGRNWHTEGQAWWTKWQKRVRTPHWYELGALAVVFHLEHKFLPQQKP